MEKLISKRSISKILLFTAMLAMSLAPTTLNAQREQRPLYLSRSGTTLPNWNIKTNLLYDATATINLGVEFRLGTNTSIDLPFNYNPWKFDNNRKWKHFLAQPEFRLWTRQAFEGHFFGVHAHYAYYNISNLPHGPFSEYMRDHRLEGWLAGAGISYGYRWNFNHWLGLEATVGVGYAYKDYEVFECRTCGDFMDTNKKHYFGPTKVGLNLVFGIDGKKVPEPKPPVIIPYEPNLSTSYVIPEVELSKRRSQSYSAYIDFEQGRSQILPGLRNNASELRRMNEVTESIAADTSLTILRITIVGYASPEGTYDRNMALSNRRTQAVSDYVVKTYKLDPNLFRVSSSGEDWATLDSLVAASTNIPDKDRVLEIIRSGDNPDTRENNLKLLSGTTYRQIFNEIYPRLRRTDYVIEYKVIPFSAEQSKQVFRVNPKNLSLNEMYMIAKLYEPGSEAFNEIFDTAVRFFPNSDVANINAAAAALERRDTDAAERYLSRVQEHTSAYWNNLGVLNWLNGKKQDAADCFFNAGIQAMRNASEVEFYFQSIRR